MRPIDIILLITILILLYSAVSVIRKQKGCTQCKNCITCRKSKKISGS